jgi:hypothetical protein
MPLPTDLLLKGIRDAKLSPKEIDAVALHCYDGCTIKGIAFHQGCDQRDAWKRLKRGLEKLMAMEIPVACIMRHPVKVIIASKLKVKESLRYRRVEEGEEL